ncbi:unnamed protein product, partial [Closterium sp. Yama58-4]
SLDHNLLVGSVPANIGYLSALTNLSMSGNALQGAIPPSLSTLVKLRVLDLSSNGLSGPIPNAFASLTLLTTLALGSNQLTGPLPASFFGLSNLAHLLIGGNRISSTLPDTISGLTSLLALDVSRNYFYGRLPTALGSLPSLLFLDMSENQFTGAPISTFASPAMANTSIATLDLSGNYLTSTAASFSAKAPTTINSTTTTKITNSTTGNSTSSGTNTTTTTLISFCPVSLQGRYASANLLVYGVSPYSSQQGNCFLGGNWNLTENFVNEKRRGNAKQGGPGGSSGGVSAKAGTTTGNSTGSSGGSASAGTGCPVGPQRRSIECVAFCGAALPAGPCGGLGTCYLSGPSNTPTCACNAGMYNVTLTLTIGKSLVSYPSCSPNPGPAPPPLPPPVDNTTMRKRDSRGANLDQAATISSTYFNPYFRYASLGFIGNLSNPTWNITPTVDWRARVPAALQPAKDQGLCSACWIFAPVAAAEALYAIVYGAAPPSLAEQKAIDCQGTWTCAGGRPDDAFNYIAASGGLPNSSAYPYTGVANNSTCKVGFARRAVFSRRLSLNEADDADTGAASSAFPVSFSSLAHTLSRLLRGNTSNGKRRTAGYAGTAATAPKKDAAAPSLPPAPFPVSMFERVGISGWLGLAIAVQQQPVVVYIEARSLSFVSYPGGFVYADPNCYSTRLVDHLVVVVGFNLLDATPHWIIRNSWGPSWGENGYMKIAIAGGPGMCGMNTLPGLYPSIVSPDPCKPINPCGGGVCTAVTGNKNMRNKCTCPANFVAVTNLDLTQSCAIAKVCSFFAMNPCGFGTCMDDSKGGYSCLCSPGYILGALTDGSATCIPGSTSVKVTLPADMSCNQVRSTYLLSKANFTKLNPSLKCPGTYPAGTVIVTRNSTVNGTACVVPYTIVPGDTCSSIAAVFNLTTADLAAVNPELDCTALVSGQLICIKSGTPEAQGCLSYYTVNPGETCNDVMINTYPPISAAQLYQYNPGIICSSDSQRLVGQDVCVDASPVVGALYCAYGYYTVVSGDTCGGVACKVFRCSYSLMYTYNPGFVCSSSTLSQLSARRHSPKLALLVLLVASSACLLCPLRSANAQAVADSQRPALSAIMDVWGAALNLNATWFVMPTCAQWQGLSCNAMGQVTSLELSYRRQLIGQSIPAAITQLGALQRLSLERNLLVGSVPSNIGYLSALTSISLGGNALQGSIPAGISTLVNLRLLDLHDNSLTGAIPDSFAPLTALATLALGDNHLTGSLPASLLAQPALQNILIGGNALTGVLPEAISAWTALLALDISRNNFYGRMPAALASLPALIHLDVSENQFTGAPISAFASPAMANTSIATLDLSGNFLTSTAASFSASSLPFCPSALQGGYAASALLSLGASPYSSQKGNCFLAGSWNTTQSFTDDKRKGGWKSEGGKSLDERKKMKGNWSSPRRSIECVAFCGAALSAGPCGGLGTCFLSGPSNTPTCACNAGMFNVQLTIQVGKELVSYPSCSPNQGPAPPPPPPPPDANTWRRRVRGADLDDTAVVRGSYFNPYFRYASLGFIGNYTSPKWNITPRSTGARVSHCARPGQGPRPLCVLVLDFRAVAAAEALYAIVYGAAAPNISEQKSQQRRAQHLLAHARPPSHAGLLVGAAAKAPPATAVPMPNSAYTVSMFERVGISGWLGLAIAVQQQPVVVYIEARSATFMNYTGGFVYADPNCYSTRLVDHLCGGGGVQPAGRHAHWIIRNSWGPSWGDNGYMKIAIAGGPGICGMNTLPGLYPSIISPDPCKPINPCVLCSGQGVRLFRNEPCGFGTCMDDSKGGYSCLCSPGYSLGQRTDGSATCIPGSMTANVTLQAAMTCSQVRSTYMLSRRTFTDLNPTLKCAGTFPPGTVIVTRNTNQTSANVTGCIVPYTVAQGDTCTTIMTMFNVTLADLNATNPDLDCGILAVGQQICISTGTPQPQSCLNFYTVNPGESCNDVMINTYPPITAAQLYQYNPGIICTADTSQRLVGQEVCVDATVVGAVKCSYGVYTVVRGDTCASVVCKVFKCSYATMYAVNPGFKCTTSTLYVGKTLCKPKP